MKTTKIRFSVWRHRRRRTKMEVRGNRVTTVRAAWGNPLFHGLALQAIHKNYPRSAGWNLMGYVKITDRAVSRKKKQRR